MSERIAIGVIGLGVMGQRMLARIAEHPRSRALAAALAIVHFFVIPLDSLWYVLLRRLQL